MGKNSVSMTPCWLQQGTCECTKSMLWRHCYVNNYLNKYNSADKDFSVELCLRIYSGHCKWEPRTLHSWRSLCLLLHWRIRNGNVWDHSDAAELTGMLSSALKQCLCSCCILGSKFWSHSEEEESQQTWELTSENHLLSHQAMKYFFDFFDANTERRSPL